MAEENKQVTEPDPNSVSNNFVGIPIAELVAAPKPQDIKVQAPFLGLVPLPNLLIDDVHVDFQMEVTATEGLAEKSASEGSTGANANFKFGCFGGGILNVSGNVSSCVEPVPGEKE